MSLFHSLCGCCRQSDPQPSPSGYPNAVRKIVIRHGISVYGICLLRRSVCSGLGTNLRYVWPKTRIAERIGCLLCRILCFVFVSGFYMLLGGRVLTGMGASMLSLNTISYAADFFPYENRGWAMGSIFSSYFAALILGVPLGSWLGDRFGWNSVFGTMGAIALVCSCSFISCSGICRAMRRY